MNKQLKWFTYAQNNSGGVFHENEYVCEIVIVQAYSAKEAWQRMDKYFDNSDSCPCCGDRWSDWVDDSDGTDIPTWYDTSVYETECTSLFRTQAKLHYYNDTVETVTFK